MESRLEGERLGQQALDAEDVRQTGVSSVAELLERDPAVVGSYGSRGERLVTIRGFEQEDIAIFVDGIPTTVPYNGSLDLGKYPASWLERVHVVPGASAGIYGPSGLGGAVEIRTMPPPEQTEARVLVRGATHGALETSASVGGTMGPLGLLVGGGGRHSPGYPLSARFEPTDREDGGLRDFSGEQAQDLLGKARLDLGGAGAMQATGHFTTGSYDVPTGLQDNPPRYWRFSEFSDLGSSVSHEFLAASRISLKETGFFTWNRNILDNYDDATRLTQDSPGAYHSTYRDMQAGGSVAMDALLGPPAAPSGILRARLYGNHQIHRSVGNVDEDPESVSTTMLSSAFTAEAVKGSFPKVFLGVELDGEIPGSDTAFEPAPAFAGPVAGIRKDWSDRVELVASVARRARFPTLKERFSSAMGYRIPNTELGPEEAWHFGLDGALRIKQDSSLTLSVYDAEVQDLIDEVTLETGEYQLQNVGRARLLGAEGNLELHPLEPLKVETGAAWLHARLLGVEAPDDQLEDRPVWKGSLAATWAVTQAFDLWTGVMGTGSQAFYDEDLARWGTLGAFFTWDGSLSWQATAGGRLAVQVRNILDANVESKWGYPDPGRMIWFSLEIRG